MSRESAGAAIRELRESRDWSLADFSSATGVSIMGLSYLERGARKPHKGTVQKVENGLGFHRVPTRDLWSPPIQRRSSSA